MRETAPHRTGFGKTPYGGVLAVPKQINFPRLDWGCGSLEEKYLATGQDAFETKGSGAQTNIGDGFFQRKIHEFKLLPFLNV